MDNNETLEETFAAGGFPVDQLSAPAKRALTAAGYLRLAALTAVTADQISDLHGMGPKGIATLREALADQGLAFADEVQETAVPSMRLELVPVPVADVDVRILCGKDGL